jgi:UDP-N-acetyl-2-amino-2-deoxyglucuronate dehydrogenase
VLNPWNLDSLSEIEKDTGQHVFHILQLRLHPSVMALKAEIDQGPTDKIYDIDLILTLPVVAVGMTTHGKPMSLIGRNTTNIGSHFFDMLTYIFGEVTDSVVHLRSGRLAAGFLQLKKARVRWFLSLDVRYIPESLRDLGKTTYRSLVIDDEAFEFSDGFSDLHTLSYQKILSGEGFTLKDAYTYVSLCHKIRSAIPEWESRGNSIPFLKS